MANKSEIPVINPAAAGKSLSFINKTKKKRISKNVLGLPENAKIRPPIIDHNEESEILNLVKRKLPAARLPFVKKKKTKEGEDPPQEDITESQEQRKKRSEISIGVNELTRDIKKSQVSAALIASDIVPSHLVAHLNFKCSHNKIPYLYLTNLRKATQEALGFPCIALGFKNNSTSFTDIVKKVTEVYDQFKREEPVSKEENEFESVEHEDNLIEENKEGASNVLTEPEFTYKYRTNKKERVFVPEYKHIENFGSDFIPIAASDSEIEEENCNIPQKSKKKSKKKKFKLEDMEIDDIGLDETEVKKKKIKKDWVIDKQPKNKNFKYAKANVIRFQSNPDRKGKSKFMKKKKISQPGKK